VAPEPAGGAAEQTQERESAQPAEMRVLALGVSRPLALGSDRRTAKGCHRQRRPESRLTHRNHLDAVGACDGLAPVN
jgi:hypothetical protein